MDPNVTQHQLELFYHVARHGGICAAARHMPYGLGQPAISGQMTELEHRLGTKLFERRPFKLTDRGRMLYDYIRPYHEGLPALWKELRGGPEHTVRLAADAMIGEEFLPAVIAATVPRPPDAGFELLTGPPAGMKAWLLERRVHLVFTAAAERIRGVQSELLAQPRLCLYVPGKTKIHSPGHFWRQGRIAERLICPPESGVVWQAFGRGLQGLRVEWPAAVRVDSQAMLMQLVANGEGVGVGLEPVSPARHPGVRALPLPGFERVQLRALWRRRVEPVISPLLMAARRTVRKSWPTAALSLTVFFAGPWFASPWFATAGEFVEQFGAVA